jgi:poly-gamma-glutamate synthesis protein (capsule biosynthesis protein)
MKILFAGDVVIQNSDLFQMSNRLKKIITSHDVFCCNFEAPILDEKTEYLSLKKAGPHILQSKMAAEIMFNGEGGNLVSIANNHIMDYGAKGLRNTIDFFLNRNIPVIGAGFSFESAYKPIIYETAHKIKVGILALAQAGFGAYKSNKTLCGHAWIHHPYVSKIIFDLRKEVDVLIVFTHAGLESEVIPLPEWQDSYRNLIDCGADLVIGSHPHIIQGYEVYNKKYIFYSLGNFYFFDEKTEEDIEWNRGILVSVDTECMDLPEIIPISVNKRGVDEDDSQEFRDCIALRTSFVSNKAELEKRADLLAAILWNQYYKSYYTGSISKGYIFPRNFKEYVKNSIKFFLGKIIKKYKIHNDIDETLLLHNIEIESHRWLLNDIYITRILK